MPAEKKQKIVLVEDDHELARMIQAFLRGEGFDVLWADNGLQGAELILEEQPDIVVLDIMLPGIDGVEVCRRIRDSFINPVLMLTAKDDDLSEVASLNTGADGYLNKPVRPHVLLAHIKSLLRRNQAGMTRLDKNIVQVQNLLINMKTYTIKKDETDVILTSGEFELLAILVRSNGVPVSRDALYQQLRGIEYDGIDRSIDLRVSSLRKKLDDDVPPYRYIKTVRSKGYLLVM
jgi:DNA-binding response OmpR family regulator